MAVIEMNKLTLIGLNTDKEQILEVLMELGVTEIIDNDRLESEDWAQLMVQDGEPDSVHELDDAIDQAVVALERLSGYASEKKPLFAGRREVSKLEFANMEQQKAHMRTIIANIHGLNTQQNELKTERNKLTNLLGALEPWQALELPLDFAGTQTTALLLGVLPTSVRVADLRMEMAEQAPESTLLVIEQDKFQQYICIIYYLQVRESLSGVLKNYAFNKVNMSEHQGTAAEAIKLHRDAIARIDAQLDEIETKMAAYALEKHQLELYYDYLVTRRDKKTALANLLRTNSVFFLEGWIPAEISAAVDGKFTGEWDCMIDIQEPTEAEEFPILLANKGLAAYVEPVTAMYGLPNCRELDPNTIMGPFFVLFFGMMLGDGGYGILLVLASVLALWKFDLEPSMKSSAKLLLYCGLSTMFWGLMFGSWFGIPYFGERPLWLNPVEQPEELLKWSLYFGVFHIYVGIGVRGANYFRKKLYFDIFADVLLWYVFFTGFVLVIMPFIPTTNLANPDAIVGIGKNLMIIGGVLLVLTQGRDKKNIIAKLVGGVASLYDVVSFMSDMLSYSRVMALGLATSIIGGIVNEMALMMGLDNLIKIIMFVIVLIAGHSLNLAINALGAFVHSIRLQYIEFFGKFYQGGGQPFKPLKYTTKYVKFKNQEG